MLSERNNETGKTRAPMVAHGALGKRIADLIEPAIIDLGYELVRVRQSGDGGGTLQIMAERPDGTMLVEDCEAVSRTISALMDVADPIKSQYMLEVSSPGIGRPLTREKDFENWAGFEVKLELSEMLAGRKRFRGTLQGVEAGEVLLEMQVDGHKELQTIGLPFTLVSDARLVITDDLVEESARRMKPAENAVQANDNADGTEDVKN